MVQTFLEHLQAAYGSGLLKGSSLEQKADGKTVFGRLGDGSPVVMFARHVGAGYSGPYKGWLTLRKTDWLRIQGANAANWKEYYVAIGHTPDDEVWWSAVYDGGLLKSVPVEEMHNGAWVRITDEDASAARLEDVDFYPPMFPDLPSGPPPDPSAVETRAALYNSIRDGLESLLNPESLKHLTGVQLAVLERYCHDVLGDWLEVRRKQGGHAA